LHFYKHQLAKTFTELLGRDITYHELTQVELAQRHEAFGLPAEYAHALAMMDTAIKNGAEDRVNDLVLTTTGRKPVGFREFVEANKAVWI
jgi:festuclavine dehydrogenase